MIKEEAIKLLNEFHLVSNQVDLWNEFGGHPSELISEYNEIKEKLVLSLTRP